MPTIMPVNGARLEAVNSLSREKANSDFTSSITFLDLASMGTSEENLLKKGLPPDGIAVIGNTFIDALLYTVTQQLSVGGPMCSRAGAGLFPDHIAPWARAR